METALATLLLSTRDQPGLVARVSTFFYERRINIVEAAACSSEGGDARGPTFFLRMSVDLELFVRGQQLSAVRGALERDLASMARPLEALWSIRYATPAARLAILVTKEAACLYDLVTKMRQGDLPCELPLVISNHAALEPVAASFGIPYHALPVSAETRPQQEDQILELLERYRIDLVVLARYMQVLSERFLSRSPPAINIHHGFLPAFQGAKPYHQARARGVKMIGATAHYATPDLDDGPIIEQDVVRVDHRMASADLARVGRDVERVVLARAVRAHLEHRVIVDGRRTVVF